MKLITLDEVVKNMYDKTVLYIKKKNIENDHDNTSYVPWIANVYIKEKYRK